LGRKDEVKDLNAKIRAGDSTCLSLSTGRRTPYGEAEGATAAAELLVI